jgi:signal transduction histidine kinase
MRAACLRSQYARALVEAARWCKPLTRRGARSNPLHGICGALQLCREPDVTAPVIAELLQSMQEGTDLMCTITNDLLDLEKLRCGKFAVVLTPVALRGIVESVATAARPACTGVLSVLFDPGVPPLLVTDGLRLRQVPTNGRSNACKHVLI